MGFFLYSGADMTVWGESLMKNPVFKATEAIKSANFLFLPVSDTGSGTDVCNHKIPPKNILDTLSQNLSAPILHWKDFTGNSRKWFKQVMLENTAEV